jgi:hypothetical protein
MGTQVKSLGADLNQTVYHPSISLSDGRSILHYATTDDGRIIGHFLRTDLQGLKKEEVQARFHAVRVDYQVSPDRHSMIFDGNSVIYFKISDGVFGLEFEPAYQGSLDNHAKRVLILSSGLPEGVLGYANDDTSLNTIQVVDNAPLAEALNAKADSVPSLRRRAVIVVGGRSFRL